jgi:hypothetical protein
MRLYTRFECNTLGGNWAPDGTCNYSGGGSWSKLCATENNTAPSVNASANNIVFESSLVPKADPGSGSSIMELPMTYPAFAVSANLIKESTINRMKTNMIVSSQYNVVIKSNVSGLTYKFPLSQITDSLNVANGNIYAYTLSNPNVQKQMNMFANANMLSFQIIENAPYVSPTTGPTLPLQLAMPPPNPLSSTPPSTMASVIPGNTTESAYQYMSQAPLLGADTLAQKIRSAEIMVKCNI